MQEFIVSTLEDENDGDFSQGDLSLREAIVQAEDGDTVTFNSSLSDGTINLNQGDLIIDKSLNIQGLGADQLTIEAGRDAGSSNVRVFNIDNGSYEVADVNISGLTITGGNVGRISGNENIANAEGGGIFNAENLRVEDSVIRDNTAVLYGGGIYNVGEVSVANSTITGNNITDAAQNGLSSIGDGGGIFNRGTATIENSSVTNNVGIDTGGIQNNSPRDGYGDSVELFVRNSTITGNSGINRTGTTDYGVEGLGAGIGGNDRTTVVSSIVADNETGITGDVVSGGNNLIANADGLEGLQDSDLFGTADNPLDPRLGELQNNGGSTLTQRLLEDSPAIDAGSNPLELNTDQRGEGFDRTVGEGTDIGAFELQEGDEISNDLVVSTLEDENDGDFSQGDLSLREAIAQANDNEGEDSITFDPSLTGGTIEIDESLGINLAIEESVSITGLGQDNLTIIGSVNIENAENSELTIDGLNFFRAADSSGFSRALIESFGDLNFINSTTSGNIISRGTTIISDATFDDGIGAAILVESGTATIERTTITSYFNGIATAGILIRETADTVDIINSTIANNEAEAIAGISNEGATVNVTNSTITGNDGDTTRELLNIVGIANFGDGEFTLTSSIVANNIDADFRDGAVPEISGTFVSGGNNIIGNGDRASGLIDSDIVGTTDNPIILELGELQDNGGSSPTIAIPENSLAIDAGSNPLGLDTDQRGEGFDRTVGEGTDIGAFELQTVTEVNEIIGTEGSDVLDGTESGDRILGLDGNDTIQGFAGDDTIEGDNGNDSLDGGTGNDLLFGLGDRDTLIGGDGSDSLDGGVGVDFLNGGNGNDQLFGDADNDSLRGGEGDDLLDGGAGIDSIEGGAGSDTLLGLDGADSLFGGNGDDLLDGGMGNDSLRGDDGDDTFVLASGNGTDTIVDFNRGNNLLGLSGGIGFADLTFSGNDIILGDETLATLNGFDAANLNESNFTTI